MKHNVTVCATMLVLSLVVEGEHKGHRQEPHGVGDARLLNHHGVDTGEQGIGQPRAGHRREQGQPRKLGQQRQIGESDL